MKKVFNYAFLAFLALSLSTTFVSCSDENEDKPLSQQEERDKAYNEIADAFVNNTVVPTYEQMALKASVLVEDLKTYRTNPTQDNLNKACEDFLLSRQWWERS